MEPEEATFKTYGVVGRLHKYSFRRQWKAFLTDLAHVPGGTISRSLAAALLDVTRQRMHQLIGDGTLRAWEFSEGAPNPRLTYSEVSSLDVLEYAAELGRPVDALDVARFMDDSQEIRDFVKKGVEEKKRLDRLVRS